jgi:hypothetical protein
MFHKIFEFLTTTIEIAPLGSTGYLDMFPWLNAGKGTDQYGRPFFVIPLETKKGNRHGPAGETVYESTNRGMVCFFKRYSSTDSPVWVVGQSHIAGANASPLLGGPVGNPTNGDVEEMLLRVLKGETVEFVYEGPEYFDSRYTRTTRMLSPQEVEEEIQKVIAEMVETAEAGLGGEAK